MNLESKQQVLAIYNMCVDEAIKHLEKEPDAGYDRVFRRVNPFGFETAGAVWSLGNRESAGIVVNYSEENHTYTLILTGKGTGRILSMSLIIKEAHISDNDFFFPMVLCDLADAEALMPELKAPPVKMYTAVMDKEGFEQLKEVIDGFNFEELHVMDSHGQEIKGE